MAGVLFAQVSGFHVDVERPFGAAGLDARDAVHLGRRFEVLEVVGLVDEQVVDTEFIKDQAVVFLVLGQQGFQTFDLSRLSASRWS